MAELTVGKVRDSGTTFSHHAAIDRQRPKIRVQVSAFIFVQGNYSRCRVLLNFLSMCLSMNPL